MSLKTIGAIMEDFKDIIKALPQKTEILAPLLTKKIHSNQTLHCSHGNELFQCVQDNTTQ
jgi:hypothetical protein